MNKREDDLIDVSLLADNAKSERIPVRDIKVGTKINGEIVDTILSSGENFAMFHFQGDRHFAYQLEGLRNIETDQAIARIGRARAKASSKLKGTVDRELDSLLKSTLRGLFQGNKPELFEDAMCQIEACVDALNEVEVTIGNSKNFIVWIDHQGELKYTASRNVADFEYSISEYTRIKSLAIALLPQELMKSFYRRLGATLTTAFRLKPEQDEIRALFKPLEQYIQLTISNNLRIKYLVTTCSSAIFLTLLTYLAHEMLIIPQFLHTSLIVIGGFTLQVHHV